MKKIKTFLVIGTICRDHHNAENGDLLKYIGMTENGIDVFETSRVNNNPLYPSYARMNAARLASYRNGEEGDAIPAILIETPEEKKEFLDREANKYKTLDQVTVDDFPVIPA